MNKGIILGIFGLIMLLIFMSLGSAYYYSSYGGFNRGYGNYLRSYSYTISRNYDFGNVRSYSYSSGYYPSYERNYRRFSNYQWNGEQWYRNYWDYDRVNRVYRDFQKYGYGNRYERMY